MVATVGLLLKKKEEDPRWVVHVEVDTATNRFRRLFWMSPEQRELAIRFGDVIINDISLMRNQYNVPLNIWIVIDHQCKSRNIAYALHTTESAEDHEWVVNILFEVLTPNPNRFYFSDFDLAIDKVLSTKDITHGLCLHHLAGNITKSLGPALGALFQSFVAAFWQVYYTISPDDFELKWAKLLEDFPRSRAYLEKVLYPVKERWAWAWISACFTCGVRTSGRVECENRVNKLFGNTKTSVYKLVKALIERVHQQKEDEKLSAVQV